MKTQFHFRRFEIKYLLSKRVADKIIPPFLQHMDCDPFSGSASYGAYVVNSLYFDNANFRSYQEKVAGVGKRRKLRLRYYNDTDRELFMEIKRKEGDVVIKDRIRLDEKIVDHIVHGNPHALTTKVDARDHVANEFLTTMHLRNMRPNIMVSYRRKAFMAKNDPTFRVTFDYDICTWKADWLHRPHGARQSVMNDGLILELKFNDTLPRWFYEIIQGYRLHRIAYSKYCMSAERLYPHLLA